jgi:hypothetical protein
LIVTTRKMAARVSRATTGCDTPTGGDTADGTPDSLLT